MDVMMGDLVLLEDEVNPVMSALLDRFRYVFPANDVALEPSLECLDTLRRIDQTSSGRPDSQ
jgi:hypothetical protein